MYKVKTGKEILRFLSLFKYDIIYIKVRHKWFGRQTSLLSFNIEETVGLLCRAFFHTTIRKLAFARGQSLCCHDNGRYKYAKGNH